MADKKITELSNIIGVNLVDADMYVVDSVAEETKAITCRDEEQHYTQLDNCAKERLGQHRWYGTTLSKIVLTLVTAWETITSS